MLKKIYIKKFIQCFIVLFAILLIYLIPKDNKKLNIKEELKYVNKSTQLSTIFLLDSNNLLAQTSVITTKKNNEELARELLETLVIDGKRQDYVPNGFKAFIPSNTIIKSINIYNEIIKVNFNEELLNANKKDEEKIIEGIVYTLTSIDGINKVMIFVNDELLTFLPKSKITLPSTLDRSYGINKEYNIDNINNLNKTTIYYVGKFNDNTYYIPVTKVNNDNRNKINIIIDELSSNNVYNTNLMSYLNSNTQIISTSQEEDSLIVNFNDAIFNDINNEDILEEVIYTVCMSIYDNYDINSIVFNVNNNEIYKSVLKTIE